jgi:branched-chain amino acid transport system ATP-binding protein
VEKLDAFYGPVQILHDINLAVCRGQIVALVGANAAGKSTLMFSLAGLRTACSGRISIGEERIDALPAYERVLRGLVLVPERRRLFPFMTVLENLEMGAYCAAARRARKATIEQVYALLPVLAERRGQTAASLSGGEQQMLAIGRGLASSPKLLMLDEPSMGLAPAVADFIFERLIDIRRRSRLTILLVEQRVAEALQFADHGYVLEAGRVVLKGANETLRADDRIRAAYLGM